MLQKQQVVDFGPTAQDYATHRAGLPQSFFERIFATGLLKPPAAVLDIGTGTGTAARGFAQRGFTVTGLDISTDMLAAARALDEKSGVEIRYCEGRAEATGQPEAAFDVVVAAQCYHWFDRAKAEAEIKRVLRPGGYFVVSYFDWISREGNPVDLMYALQRKYNPRWNNIFPGWYPQKPGDLQFEGLVSKASFFYEEDIPYAHIAWRGRMRAYGGIGGSLPKHIVDQFDAEFARALKEQFEEDPMLIPHKIWAEIWRYER